MYTYIHQLWTDGAQAIDTAPEYNSDTFIGRYIFGEQIVE